MAGKAVCMVTNNPKAYAAHKDNPFVDVDYFENGSYEDVVTRVRDRVFSGWHLLTHPQASNLRPCQCPFKTILISDKIKANPFQTDIEYVTNMMESFQKHMEGKAAPVWTEKVLPDFMTVDLDIVESALNSCALKQKMLSANDYEEII